MKRAILEVGGRTLKLIDALGQPVGSESYVVDNLDETVASLVNRMPNRRSRISVIVQRPLLQVRRLFDLPPLKSRDLEQFVRHRAGTLLRGPKEGLTIATMWDRAADGTRYALVCAAPSEIVQSVLDALRKCDVVVQCVQAEGFSDRKLMLVPESVRQQHRADWHAHLKRRVVVGVVVWLMAAGTYAASRSLELRQLQWERGRLEEPVTLTLEARGHLRNMIRMVDAVERADDRRLAAVAAIQDVVAHLDRASHIIELSWYTDSATRATIWSSAPEVLRDSLTSRGVTVTSTDANTLIVSWVIEEER